MKASAIIGLLAAFFLAPPSLAGEGNALFSNAKGDVPPIDREVSSAVETAVFGLGWFWGAESRFGVVDGVIRTRVGYAGGTAPDPTYRAMGDHTETVQVVYDSSRITYEQLLAVFWQSHEPWVKTTSRQYRKAVFYSDERQQELATASRKALALTTKRPVHSKVLPIRSFTTAEEYHQKYYLKQHPLLEEIQRIYPRHEDLVDSTAATRTNGYLGGYGTAGQLDLLIDRLGLSVQGKRQLRRVVGR